MNDDFLSEMRRDPDPEFANRLRGRLRRAEHEEAMPGLRWRPALAIAATLAVIAGLFAFPSVRASATAMLDLFRVRNFAAVPFDPTRLEKLDAKGDQNSPLAMLAKPEILKEPGEPKEITRQQAESMSSLPVRFPSEMPNGLKLKRVMVQGEGEVRLTAEVAKLRSVLEALDIRDITVPQSIDGHTITVRKPLMVIQEYESAHSKAAVIQARSPEIEMPAGIDLSQLAEIAMRVIGVEPAQARRLAQTVDWHSTLLVPVPMNASSFHSVEVHGQPGLLVNTTIDRGPDGKGGKSDRTIVMWSEGDRVYAVMGKLPDTAVMQIAESIR